MTDTASRGGSRALRRLAMIVTGLLLLAGLTAFSLALLAPPAVERCDPDTIMPAEQCPLSGLP